MIQTLPLRVDSVSAQQRANRRTSTWSYLAVVGAGLVIGLAGFGALADPFALAFAVLVCGAAAILFRPIAGVYLTVFFSVLGDKAHDARVSVQRRTSRAASRSSTSTIL